MSFNQTQLAGRDKALLQEEKSKNGGQEETDRTGAWSHPLHHQQTRRPYLGMVNNTARQGTTAHHPVRCEGTSADVMAATEGANAATMIIDDEELGYCECEPASAISHHVVHGRKRGET